MFNKSLKKQALLIHEDMLNQYNTSYEKMSDLCDELYKARTEAIETIQEYVSVINSIANTPKDFSTKMGAVGNKLTEFKKTEEYAQQAYAASVKAGVGIAGGAAAGVGIASMAPTALMSIATTFGTATTGRAISALSGAAAQKAALAWIGRTFAGFAVKGGAGMAVGQAFLALAGPVGWGISAASTGLSLIGLSNKNKKISDDAVKEAKEIAKAREALDEISTKISALFNETKELYRDLFAQRKQILELRNANYVQLDNNKQLFLGAVVNNVYSLSELILKKVE